MVYSGRGGVDILQSGRLEGQWAGHWHEGSCVPQNKE